MYNMFYLRGFSVYLSVSLTSGTSYTLIYQDLSTYPPIFLSIYIYIDTYCIHINVDIRVYIYIYTFVETIYMYRFTRIDVCARYGGRLAASRWVHYSAREHASIGCSGCAKWGKGQQ